MNKRRHQLKRGNKGIKVIIVLLSLLGVFSIVSNIFLMKQTSILKESEELLDEKFRNLSEEHKELSLMYDLSQEEIERLNRLDLFEFTPTFQEVKEVLREDKIDEVPYDEEDFSCAEYSFGLIQTFFGRKIHTCTVYVIFEDGAHSIVAINTSDKGLIYVEPQTDDIIFDLNVGDDYCKKMNWICNWKITKIKSCFSKID